MKRWPSPPWSGKPLASGMVASVMPMRSVPEGAWAWARSHGRAAASGAAAAPRNRARRVGAKSGEGRRMRKPPVLDLDGALACSRGVVAGKVRTKRGRVNGAGSPEAADPF